MRFVTAATNIRIYNFTHKFKEVDANLLLRDKFKYLPEYEVK